MKDFTTPEYITPIIAEISALYTPVINPAVNKALNCNMLLQHNHSRNALVIRENETFYYSRGAARELLQEVKSYAETAETYPGELDRWTWDEETRIMSAVRDAIINKYAA